jgi:proprotein convertase subtilisin/kexin type 5
MSCAADCFTCTSLTVCTSCDESKYLLFNGKCHEKSSCEVPGSMGESDYSSTCQSCPTNCASCDKDSGECTSCKSKYYLSENKICMECINNCLLCYDPFTCSLCAPGYFADNNICSLIFTENKKLIEKENEIKSETNNYNETSSFDNDQMINSEILNCMFNNKNFLDICLICKKGYYFSTIDLKCVLCPPHCLACKNEKFCTKCEENHVFYLDKNTSKVGCKPRVINYLF